MQQNTNNLTENEKKFLLCLLDDGSLTDTKISQKIKVNKSTCSRIRKKLEKEFISGYIPIVDLDKVGIDIFIVLTFQWKEFNNKELTKRFFIDLEKDPHVIFLANGEGAGITTVVFLGFRNIQEYHNYFKEFRNRYDKYLNNINSLILPSKEVKKNDFTEIIKYVLENQK